MNSKTGRNDPCPCGSGKKYKHCCSLAAAPDVVPAESHDGAVARALAWLNQHHRKAMGTAMQTAIDETVFEICGDDEVARGAMAGMSDELWQQVEINFTEWLLAEGDIQVKGEMQRVSELLFGPRGPLLTTDQRVWLEQLARRPLRLYDVTEVVPDASITLCDALDTEQLAVVVVERAGSRSLRVGMQIGARVMQVAAQHQLSGAMYPFSAWAGREVQSMLRNMLTEPGLPEEDRQLIVSQGVMEGWLEQYLIPARLPQFIDASTGEPMLYVTDHYEVQDWDALTTKLATQPDVEGNRDSRWDRLLEGEDGLTRPLATITPESGGRRVAVQYRTAGLAEKGRAWFDALAGDSAKFLLQEVSDPKGLLSQSDTSKSPTTVSGRSLPPGMDSEALSVAFETAVKGYYANWADEPIPALNDQTPRQAIQSVAGLERVKGLLRTYEDGEAQQAAQQGRREMSYQFLWDSLGLTRTADSD